jgi:hypothetical protein
MDGPIGAVTVTPEQPFAASLKDKSDPVERRPVLAERLSVRQAGLSSLFVSEGGLCGLA